MFVIFLQRPHFFLKVIFFVELISFVKANRRKIIQLKWIVENTTIKESSRLLTDLWHNDWCWKVQVPYDERVCPLYIFGRFENVLSSILTGLLKYETGFISYANKRQATCPKRDNIFNELQFLGTFVLAWWMFWKDGLSRLAKAKPCKHCGSLFARTKFNYSFRCQKVRLFLRRIVSSLQ